MAIETERLFLRLFEDQDLPSLREIDSEQAVLRYRSRPVITEKMTRRFLTYAKNSIEKDPRKFYAYAIELKEGMVWLGQCGMSSIAEQDTHDKIVSLWYSLLPGYWGRGYMTEAVQALIQLGFDKFGLSVISAECDPDNVASYRVMEKAGLFYTGRIQRTDDQGNTFDRIQYELTYPEFLKNMWPTVNIGDPV